jgi:sporulation protein YlmC with PRC-barrel domain
MTRRHAFALALSTALVAPHQGLAQVEQQTQRSTAPANQQQVAEQCMQDLRSFSQRIEEDPMWVTGWGSRWGYGVGSPARTDPATGIAATGAPPADAGAMTSPWGAAGNTFHGAQSPRAQIETLYRAAHVLAARGDQEGCQYVLSELETVYDDYTSRLERAGVEAGEVTTWRQERMLAAQPVSEVRGQVRLTVDDVTGTDVRNLQDEHLGSVSDVIIDDNAGEIAYAVVARGGFLGIGEDHVAVPWQEFRLAPGLNTLVLDVPEQTIAEAPSVDPNTFGGLASDQDREIETYWQEHGQS